MLLPMAWLFTTWDLHITELLNWSQTVLFTPLCVFLSWEEKTTHLVWWNGHLQSLTHFVLWYWINYEKNVVLKMKLFIFILILHSWGETCNLLLTLTVNLVFGNCNFFVAEWSSHCLSGLGENPSINDHNQKFCCAMHVTVFFVTRKSLCFGFQDFSLSSHR